MKRGGSVAQTINNDDFNDRLINAESIMEKEMSQEVLFPRLMNVLSQDHLLEPNKHMLSMQDLTGNRADMSTVTDNRQTAVETNP